uniref:Secreted protein n=1 Tax=Caenorhabditis tropicalis TaxID=1561998 RepID=A0A1I7U144_9PELO
MARDVRIHLAVCAFPECRCALRSPHLSLVYRPTTLFFSFHPRRFLSYSTLGHRKKKERKKGSEIEEGELGRKKERTRWYVANKPA